MEKRRYIIGALAVLLILFILIFLLGCAVKKDRPVRICEEYIVSQGETLWEISDKFTRGDKRAWIYEVRQINGIEGSVNTGDVIYVFSE